MQMLFRLLQLPAMEVRALFADAIIAQINASLLAQHRGEARIRAPAEGRPRQT